MILAAGLLAATAPAQVPTGKPPPRAPTSPMQTSLSQCGSAQLTVPANYLRASQVPSTWRVDQIVIGSFNFTTNGKSPEYPMAAGSNTKEVVEEHSVWCLTYQHTQARGYFVQTTAKWWHRQTHTQTVSGTVSTGLRNVSYDTIVTVITQKWLQNAASPGQTSLTIQNGGTGVIKHRSVVMSTGISLPQILTQTETVTSYYQGGPKGSVVYQVTVPFTPDPNTMIVFLSIGNWMVGQWDTPYSGEITAQNDYINYISRPPLVEEWLEVHAIWKTTPGPGQ